MRTLFAVVCCLVPLSSMAVGQESRPSTPAKAPFVFEAGDIPLLALVERCASYLQCNILCDEVELQGANGAGRQQPRRVRNAAAVPAAPVEPTPEAGPFVSLQLPVVTDRDGCEDLLTGLLWSFGLALVPIDEAKHVYEVLSMSGSRAREVPTRTSRRTPEQVMARPACKRFVSVVLPLQHTNAVLATNALRPFFANYTGPSSCALMLGNAGNSSAVVLSGPQDQVAIALQVLQEADVAGGEPTLMEARVEELARQNAELLQRIAALEQKLGSR